MSGAEVWNLAAAIMASLGGGAAIVLGFSGWFGRLWAERILNDQRHSHAAELERVRADLQKSQRELQIALDRTLYVSKLQWDTEFAAITDVWAKMTDVQYAFLAVRPLLDVQAPSEEAHTERLYQRVQRLGEAYNAARLALDTKSPFLPQLVFESADLALRTALMEAHEAPMEERGPERADYWKEASENRTEFAKHLKELANRIRTRLADVVIVTSGEAR